MRQRPRTRAAELFRLALPIVILLLAAPVFGQVSSTTSGLIGVVTDSTKGVLPGVTVSLKNLGTGQVRTTPSSGSGEYRFVGLDPGDYEVTFELSGFKTVVIAPVTLVVGTAPRLDASLELGALNETVTVSGQSALIETSNTSISHTIERRELETIPLNSRNPVELTLLTPNTVPSVSRRDNGIYINVSGGRAREPVLNLDGLDNIDDSNSQQRALFSREAIREFQVLANNFSAEFGRTQGAVVNVVTKSGGNSYEGSAYLFHRNKDLNARNAFEQEKAPFKRWQTGGTFGGPIKQNRMFFFGAFERQNADIPAFSSVSPENARLLGIPESDIGEIPRNFDYTSLITKFTYQMNDRHSFDGSYIYSFAEQLRYSSVGGLNTLRRAGSKHSTDSFYTVAWRTVGQSWFHEARASYSPRNFEFWYQTEKPEFWGEDNPVLFAEPTVSVSGVASFGQSAGNHFKQNKIYFVDSLSVSTANHDLKVGADLLLGENYRFLGGSRGGSYSFSNLANFLAGRYTQFSQTFGNSTVRPQHNHFSFYAQDNFRATSRLSINAGVRYDIETLPDFYDPDENVVSSSDRNNVSPRFGAAFDVFGNGNTVVRGGSGIFYTRRFINQVANLLTGSPNRGSFSYLLRFGDPGAPTYPNRLTAQPTGSFATPNLTATYDLPVPWSVQANAAVEQRLTSSMVASVEFNLNRSTAMASAQDTNPIDPVTRRRPNPAYGRIVIYDSNGRATYKAVSFLLRRQASSGFAFQTFYTLGFDKNDTQDFSDLPTIQTDRSADWGWSVDDVRHRWVMSGTYLVPDLGTSAWQRFFSGFQFSGAATYRSPFPMDPSAGTDINGDGVVNDRAPGLARNSFRAFDYASVDLRVSRLVRLGGSRLELVAEVFNILNRTNYDSVNEAYGLGPAPRPTFGAPASAYDPRQMQIGAKITF
ncbi:MAG: TonB-dependent receptor [Vicinamibacterales bacterium]